MQGETRAAPQVWADYGITTFFAGRTRGVGILESPRGRLKKRFVCEIDGGWEGGEFVMREVFTHDDGTVDHRQWRIVPADQGRFTGRAEDVIGLAEGRTDRDEIRIAYTLRVPVKTWRLPIRFDDRLLRMDDAHVLNRSTMYLMGVRVGELTFWFEKC
jgi:hypothetical protein